MDKKLNCVIVDDEQHAVDLITQLARKHPHLNVVQTFTNSLDALAGIVNGVDVLFLDIDMPCMNGLELAALLRSKVNYLVFITSHEQFALPAFEVSADQYLVKPVSELDFFKSIARLNRNPQALDQNQPIALDDGILVKHSLKGHFSRMEKSDIMYIETIKGTNYVKFTTRNQSYKTNLTLRSLEKTLEGDGRFMRISRAAIVRLAAITDIKGNTLRLTGEKELMLGDEFREDFMAYVQSKLSKG